MNGLFGFKDGASGKDYFNSNERMSLGLLVENRAALLMWPTLPPREPESKPG